MAEWNLLHKQSEVYASEAEVLSRRQKYDEALELYLLAARKEAMAVEFLDFKKTRTLGILCVSAASLYLKANQLFYAKLLAKKYRETKILPFFAIEELELILTTKGDE
jgi:hypothetical protein